MFNLFKPKAPEPKTSVITFDEAYCHSAGDEHGGQVYEISPGTTEIVFAFPDFDGFMRFYYRENPYLDEAIREAVREEQAYFCAQIVDRGVFICAEGIDDADRIAFNAETLIATDRAKPFTEFSDGAIAFGIMRKGGQEFAVLWATMYRSA